MAEFELSDAHDPDVSMRVTSSGRGFRFAVDADPGAPGQSIDVAAGDGVRLAVFLTGDHDEDEPADGDPRLDGGWHVVSDECLHCDGGGRAANGSRCVPCDGTGATALRQWRSVLVANDVAEQLGDVPWEQSRQSDQPGVPARRVRGIVHPFVEEFFKAQSSEGMRERLEHILGDGTFAIGEGVVLTPLQVARLVETAFHEGSKQHG